MLEWNNAQLKAFETVVNSAHNDKLNLDVLIFNLSTYKAWIGIR